jgi:large subunit ribosomal protein L4
MKLDVITYKGEKTGRSVTLPKSVFEAEPNDHAIYMDVKHHLANRRQGTHKTKERAEIQGSTKKIKRQKGTGTARAGDIKNPLFRGGGTIFGPRPKTYGFKLNKKLKIVARKSAFSYQAKKKNITVLEDFSFDAPKTKSYSEFLNNLSVNDIKTLLLVSESDKNLYLSSRNLKNAKVVEASRANTYEILHADKILLSEGSIKKIEELLSK